MDKLTENTNNNYNHTFNIVDRKSIYITGVNKVESFDDQEFLIETNMGYIAIKGQELEIIKLDAKEGIISIKGLIIGLSYIEELKKMNKENSIIHKLFK